MDVCLLICEAGSRVVGDGRADGAWETLKAGACRRVWHIKKVVLENGEVLASV